MRASRRSLRPNSPRITRRQCSFLSGLQRPASDPPQATIWSLAECISRLVLQPFHRLRSFRADGPLFVSVPFHRVMRLRAVAIWGPSNPAFPSCFPVACAPLWHPVPPCFGCLSSPPLCLRTALVSQLSVAGIPRPCPAGFPKAPVLVKSGKSLVPLWFPAASPPPYSYETVIESVSCKAGNGHQSLLTTWITCTRLQTLRRATSPARPVRIPRIQSRAQPRNSPKSSPVPHPPPATARPEPALVAPLPSAHPRPA